LTPNEAVASVARRVRCYEAQGFDREQAVQRTSVEMGIDPDKVRWCAQKAFPDAPAQLSPSGMRRRRALAIAAVL
jgi:hypothetical protein